MKRFWKDVTVKEVAGGYQVALDGRPLKTQGKSEQIVPSRALAEALAYEWRAQGEDVDAAAFPHRDMADFAIDRIATGAEDSVGKLLAFAETDTLCYRADPDEPLFRRQQELWEPLLTALEAREGVRLARASGVMHRPQPGETIETLRARLQNVDPLTQAALLQMASLAASLTIALAALEPDADIEALWNAANLEEDWQIELWGEDAEAAARRADRAARFAMAARFALAARSRDDG
ncbi:molecular chaperone [Erythrobacter sp. LQ02-29]|uniref:ATP12 family chaperone protein n=1 Tax=Erythrobacter sp. LQ02-29 TaxID=2920384 RepID=UPI001F4E9A16|nr:molecular chaperone [Erythrobacter sp. LQ02-29]